MTDAITQNAECALTHCRFINMRLGNNEYISPEAAEIMRRVSIYARELSQGKAVEAADVYEEANG